jgi:hypothetical protein
MHGGGWVMGGLNSENGFLRHVCKCSLTSSFSTQPADMAQICVALSSQSIIGMLLSTHIPPRQTTHWQVICGS